MSDNSTFGSEPTDEQDAPIRMAVAPRPVNSMEHELTVLMTEELPSTLVPFVEDDGTLGNQHEYVHAYGRPFTVSEALLIGGLIEEPVIEKYRRQICTARELGPHATLADYLFACHELQGIPPILEEKIK